MCVCVQIFSNACQRVPDKINRSIIDSFIVSINSVTWSDIDIGPNLVTARYHTKNGHTFLTWLGVRIDLLRLPLRMVGLHRVAVAMLSRAAVIWRENKALCIFRQYTLRWICFEGKQQSTVTTFQANQNPTKKNVNGALISPTRITTRLFSENVYTFIGAIGANGTIWPSFHVVMSAAAAYCQSVPVSEWIKFRHFEFTLVICECVCVCEVDVFVFRSKLNTLEKLFWTSLWSNTEIDKSSAYERCMQYTHYKYAIRLA